ncbi:hypothetical protein PSYMO_36398, partial [Pseudomonas amygdali pv. mori str. 301020]
VSEKPGAVQMPHLELLMDIAHRVGFDPADQIFNVNRFSGHYSRP